MRRSFRDSGRGFSPQNPALRIGSMVALLVVVGLIYSRAKRPETWKWLASDNDEAAQAVNSRTNPGTTAPRSALPGRDSAMPRAADPASGTTTVGEARKHSQDASNATTTATGTAVRLVEANPQPTPAITSTNIAGRAEAVPPNSSTPRETIVPGPTDLAPDEQAAAKIEFELLTDREDLERNEMAAYWRLFRWTWAQTYAELEKRAQRPVFYRQLWEAPDKYRGKPIKLRLHVKQIVKWDAPENRGNFQSIYEIWGATDESQSYPYVVVVSELPDDMKIGANLRYEGTFVGYFLKNMAYRAHDLRRGAPLLIGRIQWQNNASSAARDAADDHALWNWLAGIGVAVAAGAWIWLRFSRIGKPTPAIAPTAESDMEAWFEQSPAEPLTGGPFTAGSGFSVSPTEPLSDRLPPPVAGATPSTLSPSDTGKSV